MPELRNRKIAAIFERAEDQVRMPVPKDFERFLGAGAGFQKRVLELRNGVDQRILLAAQPGQEVAAELLDKGEVALRLK